MSTDEYNSAPAPVYTTPNGRISVNYTEGLIGGVANIDIELPAGTSAAEIVRILGGLAAAAPPGAAGFPNGNGAAAPEALS